MTPQQKEFRAVRKAVKQKAKSGALRDALKGSALTSREIDTVVRHAVDCRHMRNVPAVQKGWVRKALEAANWPENEIDFLINRSYSRIYRQR